MTNFLSPCDLLSPLLSLLRVNHDQHCPLRRTENGPCFHALLFISVLCRSLSFWCCPVSLMVSRHVHGQDVYESGGAWAIGDGGTVVGVWIDSETPGWRLDRLFTDARLIVSRCFQGREKGIMAVSVWWGMSLRGSPYRKHHEWSDVVELVFAYGLFREIFRYKHKESGVTTDIRSHSQWHSSIQLDHPNPNILRLDT